MKETPRLPLYRGEGPPVDSPVKVNFKEVACACASRWTARRHGRFGAGDSPRTDVQVAESDREIESVTVGGAAREA